MGLFHSTKESAMGEDTKLYQRTANVQDPVLNAVNERQPYEAAADTTGDNPNRLSFQQISSGGGMKDVFGAPIQQTDISNPTRARNERPMDTIRGFEYAISGDLSLRDQLETPQLGWGFHSGPGRFNYGSQDSLGYGNDQQQGYENQPLSFAFQEQAVYTAPVVASVEKKKKRGLFGRKK